MKRVDHRGSDQRRKRLSSDIAIGPLLNNLDHLAVLEPFCNSLKCDIRARLGVVQASVGITPQDPRLHIRFALGLGCCRVRGCFVGGFH